MNICKKGDGWMKIKTFVAKCVIAVSAEVLAFPAKNNLKGGSRMLLQSWRIRISPDCTDIVEAGLVVPMFLPSPFTPLFLIC